MDPRDRMTLQAGEEGGMPPPGPTGPSAPTTPAEMAAGWRDAAVDAYFLRPDAWEAESRGEDTPEAGTAEGADLLFAALGLALARGSRQKRPLRDGP